MNLKPIIIFLFLLIIIVIIIYLYIKFKKKQLENLKLETIKISSKNFKYKSNRCNSYTISDSQGLLCDEAIVCNTLKNLKATPYFYFENFNNESTINDWIFVNLDWTNFDNFQNKNSPDNIVCKNTQTFKILSNIFPNKNVLYTGFTSIDKFKPEIKKDYRKIIHIVGKSPYKGTTYIVKTWLLHKEWPTLTIICNNKASVVDDINKITKNQLPKNIKLITNFLEEDELVKYMNEYGIHLCLSKFEGFGHNSNEARSVEAVTLYTDMPCFQERFKDGISGIATKCKQDGFENKICPIYIPTREDIEEAVIKVLKMSEEELSKIGKQARQEFLKDDIEFRNNLVSLVKGTKSIPYIIHNMWISKDLPYENVSVPKTYIKNLKTLYENNKNFEFMYWSGEDVLHLINDNFPEYLDFYKKLEPTICKCDFARFVVIAVYGGIYIDLDFYCKKNLSELLTGESYFVYEPNDKHGTNVRHLFNGIFASYKNNPFIIGWIKQMEKNKDIQTVMKKTGPIALYNYYKKNKNKVLFGDSCDVLSIIDNNEISKQCKGKYNNYTTTLWYEGSGWGGIIKPSDSINFIKIINPIDGSVMLWEESGFTKNNFPGPDYEIQEKRDIFEYAKNNKYNHGIIDVGAHIGDLSIPLALALKNIDRDDVIVYVIDPSQEKCDFIEKMSLINSVSNIKILNYGLSDYEKILGHESTSDLNTGAQTWNIQKEKKILTKTNENESNIFITLDYLFKKREIGKIGIYHIDVEGHEIDVLKGSENLINTCEPILFIENYISKNVKCKNKNDCPLLFKTIRNINPYYKHTRFLPNKDLIFQT